MTSAPAAVTYYYATAYGVAKAASGLAAGDSWIVCNGKCMDDFWGVARFLEKPPSTCCDRYVYIYICANLLLDRGFMGRCLMPEGNYYSSMAPTGVVS